MKPLNHILHWGGLAAIALVTALSFNHAQAGDTKRFKETGTETVVTSLAPGALLQPLFVQARALYGAELEGMTFVIQQFSNNNVGGRGVSVVFEAFYSKPGAPLGVIVYVMKYETVANGDRFVVAGSLMPQADGTFVVDFSLIPELGTGRFAAATGSFTELVAIPGGYVGAGTITTVGATKK